MAELDWINSNIARKRGCTGMAPLKNGRLDWMSGVRKFPLFVIGAAALGLIVTTCFARGLPHTSPPPIAENVKCENWRNCREASYAFTQILRKRFPFGTHDRVLRTALLDQGFSGLPASITSCLPHGQEAPVGKMVIECPAWDPSWNPENYLAYGWGVAPCGSQLSVKWSADKKGKITHLEGYYDYTCL